MRITAWGMIGCGEVTQVKSGPAFNKVENSFIAAVMSRDPEKARHYTLKNNIPNHYGDVYALLRDPDVNAIYIATPPSSHEAYAMLAIEAGKNVYIEKPISLDHASAVRIVEAAETAGVKLVVAHYRRKQPLFKKVKELLGEGAIGQVRLAVCNYQKIVQSNEELAMPGNKWRVDPSISGGGIFHDLAPHQLDLMLYFFGDLREASGYSGNQCGLYDADDVVAGTILFENGVLFSGNWLFNGRQYVDQIEITGSRGRIWFGAFQHEVFHMEVDGKTESYYFENLQHVQMPLIAEVVGYFQGQGPNPCAGKYGVDVMKIIDAFTTRG